MAGITSQCTSRGTLAMVKYKPYSDHSVLLLLSVYLILVANNSYL